MKIGFISLMEGSPWGGSEELWLKVAINAIEQKSKVVICTKGWDDRNDKLQNVVNRGAVLYERWYKKRFFLDRFCKKCYRVISGRRLTENWSWLQISNPEILLVSMGSPHEILNHIELLNFLKWSKLPYLVIQQFNFDHIVYNDLDRSALMWFYKNATFAYFVSARNLQTTQRSIACKLNNSKTISNPLLLNGKEIMEYHEFSQGEVRFACVARLQASFKGQDLLIEALSSFYWKQRSWKLNFYGEGPDLAYLKELTELFDLQEKVSFCGHVADIESVWSDNHILILPSLAEGTPLSIIESMFCGRPAIVTNVGGNAELIENGVTGYVIPSVNVESIRETLDKAWMERAKWKVIGQNAQVSVQQRVNLNDHVEIYNDILNSLSS